MENAKEITNLIKNKIRKVKQKIISDSNFETNLLSPDETKFGNRPFNTRTEKNGSENDSELGVSGSRTDKIKLVEAMFKSKTQEKFKEKQQKRKKVLDEFEKQREEEIIRRKEANEKRQLQSKAYFNQLNEEHEKTFKQFLEKNNFQKQNVQKALNTKREQITKYTQYQQFKQKSVKSNFLNSLNEREVASTMEYLNNRDKLISKFYSLKQPEPKNENYLEVLKKTGKLDRLKNTSQSKHEELTTKITSKHKRKLLLESQIRESKYKNTLQKAMLIQTKHQIAERNRTALSAKKASTTKKYDLVKDKLRRSAESKEHLKAKKRMFELIREEINAKFENLLTSKKRFNEEDLRALLYSLIPKDYVTKQELIDEIEIACSQVKEFQSEGAKALRKNRNREIEVRNDSKEVEYEDIDGNKVRLKSAYSSSGKGLSFKPYDPCNQKNFLSQSLKTPQTPNPQTNEILEMLAKEREREIQRQEILSNEKNPTRLREYNIIFTQEKIAFSKQLLEKQKKLI